MAYDEKLADRIREALAGRDDVAEKKMFRGVTFMVDGKMCICVSHDELMCRISPQDAELALEENGIRPMVHGGRQLKGYVYVSPELLKTTSQFEHWLQLCLDFNRVAKSSKK